MTFVFACSCEAEGEEDGVFVVHCWVFNFLVGVISRGTDIREDLRGWSRAPFTRSGGKMNFELVGGSDFDPGGGGKDGSSAMLFSGDGEGSSSARPVTIMFVSLFDLVWFGLVWFILLEERREPYIPFRQAILRGFLHILHDDPTAFACCVTRWRRRFQPENSFLQCFNSTTVLLLLIRDITKLGGQGGHVAVK